MRILVLMPVDEQHVPAATAIYQARPPEMQKICFPRPRYRQYLVSTHMARNWEQGMAGTFLAAKDMVTKRRKRKEDWVLIGNINRNFSQFDAIFNFQDIEADLPYEDKFLEKAKTRYEGSPDRGKYIELFSNLYEAKDSQYQLHNCKATANFLTDYYNSSHSLAKLEVLKQKYSKEIAAAEKIVARYTKAGVLTTDNKKGA